MAGVAFLVALTGGCSTLQLERAYAVPPITVADEGGERSYHHYVGVYHVHTEASHDASGTLEQALRDARRTHCDFVVVTDHNTDHHRPVEGMHDGVLLIVGEELSLRAGHFAAIGHRSPIQRYGETQAAVDQVRETGGMGFIAHPEGGPKHWDWEDWSVDGFHGMEIYSYSADAVGEGIVPLVLMALAVYPVSPDLFTSIVLDPPKETLRIWDQLHRERRVVGLAASDSHGRVRVAGIPVSSYEEVFRLVRNHVWARDPGREGILEAIRAGHVYIGFDIFGDTSGFTFAARRPDGRTAILGDRIELAPGMVLEARLPSHARVRLLRDGEVVAKSRGTRLDYRPDRPGVYRVEAFREGPPLDLRVPWIISNPIYVAEPADEGIAAVVAVPPLGGDAPDPIPIPVPAVDVPATGAGAAVGSGSRFPRCPLPW